MNTELIDTPITAAKTKKPSCTAAADPRRHQDAAGGQRHIVGHRLEIPLPTDVLNLFCNEQNIGMFNMPNQKRWACVASVGSKALKQTAQRKAHL